MKRPTGLPLPRQHRKQFHPKALLTSKPDLNHTVLLSRTTTSKTYLGERRFYENDTQTGCKRSQLFLPYAGRRNAGSFCIYHFPCLPVNLQPWSARTAAENPPLFLFSAVCPNLIRGDPLRRPSAAPIAV